MNKKIILFFVFFALSLSLMPRYKSYASVNFRNYDNYGLVYTTQNSGGEVLYRTYYWGCNGNVITNNTYGYLSLQNCIYCDVTSWSQFFDEQFFIESNYYTYTGNVPAGYTNPSNETPIAYILLGGSWDLTGDNVYDSWDDYINPPQPELSWYEELFNDFIDYIGAGLNNGIDGFLDWLREAWITPVGEGEDELALDLITPIPTPTLLPTPTPIPYQTQLVPDGNGGYNISYIYLNPSGVPTSAPQPPTNQPQLTGSGSNDDDFDYPYYDNPNNKDDPYTLDIPWYLKFSFGGAVTSLDDFQEGMDAIVDNVNDQDENISVVMDSMGLFPSDWLLMIGFIGAIPLVGGLISRLLKG